MQFVFNSNDPTQSVSFCSIPSILESVHRLFWLLILFITIVWELRPHAARSPKIKTGSVVWLASTTNEKKNDGPLFDFIDVSVGWWIHPRVKGANYCFVDLG